MMFLVNSNGYTILWLTPVLPPSRSFRPMVERSPEKAGVGGSIPSLATIFSRSYKPSFPNPASNCVQNSVDQRAQLVHCAPLRLRYILNVNVHSR